MTQEISSDETRLKALQEAVAATPDSADAHLRLGTTWLQMGQARPAEVELRRAIELDPDCVKAWVNLGGLLLGRLDFPGCVEANRQAATRRPDLLEAHYNQGLGHLYLGEAEEMVACFRRVLEINPRHPGGNYHLAVGLLARRQVAEARISLSKAMELGYSPRPEFLKALERESGGNAATIEIEPGRSDNPKSRES